MGYEMNRIFSIITRTKSLFSGRNLVSRIARVTKQYLTILRTMGSLRKHGLLPQYFSSPQFKRNNWSFDQCKKFGQEFEKVYYDDGFATRFNGLLRGLDREDSHRVKFLFMRMMFLSFLNRDGLFEEKESDCFLAHSNSADSTRHKDGAVSFGKYKFTNNNFTAHNFYENLGLDLIDASSARDKSIIDVGAFIGDSSLVLCQYTEKNVYAFEPFADTHTELSENIKLNAISNIVPVKLGVSDSRGRRRLYFSDLDHSISTNDPTKSLSDGACTKSMEIDVTTIDDFTAGNNLDVGIIKIDAEGAEQAVLRGAVETIKRNKPILLVSIYHNVSDFMDIKPWIDALGLGYRYKVTKLEPTTFIEETMLICY